MKEKTLYQSNYYEDLKIHKCDITHNFVQKFKENILKKETDKKILLWYDDLLNRDYSKAYKIITTNYIKFYNLKDEYIKNFWWPHTDDHCLYNCIIYFNKSTCDGTNLYEKLLDNEGSEHTNPWQNKNKYNLLYNIKSAYNRLVIFKANIYHGMAYDNDKFKNNFRKNQIIFIK